MNRLFFFFILFLEHTCLAQVSVTNHIDYVRNDVAYYVLDYPLNIQRLGYDSIDANGLVMFGSYSEADSLISGNPMRTMYQYDEIGRKIKYQAWKEVNNTKKIFVDELRNYSPTGKLAYYRVIVSGSIQEQLDTISKSSEINFFYNEKDSLSSKIVNYLDENGNWFTAYKFTFDYYANGSLLQENVFKWNTGNWILFDSNYFRYSYSLTQDPVFTNLDKLQVIYKSQSGKDSVKINMVLDSNVWTNKSKLNYFYAADSVGRSIDIHYYSWQKASANWGMWPYSYEYWKVTNENKLLAHSIGYYYRDFEFYSYYKDGKLKTASYGYDHHSQRRYSSHSYTYKKIDDSLSAADFDFLIYPNPAKGNLNLLANFTQTEAPLISVFNALGEVVSQEEIEIIAGKVFLELPLENLKGGVYYVSIRSNDSIRTQKFIISE